MMGLRNLMLKKNEAADNGLEVTVFCQQSYSVTMPSAVTCKNVTELSSFMNEWGNNSTQDIYFPNVRSIYYNAFSSCYLYEGTIHLNASYKADIMGSSGYPSFGASRAYHTFVFDINAAKLTINKSSDVTTLWIDDLTSTADYEWIPKNKDVPIIALNDTAVLVDTVNTPTDLTYTVTMPTSNPVGINLTGAEGTASTSIKYGTRNLTAKTGLNPYLYAPSGTTLNYDMILTTSDGDFYTYAADLTSLVDITTADMVARQAFFRYDGTTYYVTDTLTTFDDLYSWISSNYSSTYASQMTELYDTNIETLSTRKLRYNRYLTLIYLTKCTSVDTDAVYGCTSLETLNLPACTSIGSDAFNGCYYLETLNLPACTSIGSGAFSSCNYLETLNLPACTSIGSSAFDNCVGLKTVSLPKCTSIGDCAFQYCRGYAIDFSLPVCESIGSSAFYGCSCLTTLNLPACTSIGSNAFSSCSSLTSIHFAAANQATIEALSGYSSKWGASSATIYFDL
jgi:hypothetical protein